MTKITMILDNSGSMGVIRKAASDGINEFLDEQKKLKEKAFLSVIQFDSTITETAIGLDLKDAPNIQIRPKGLTALLDAIGHGIIKTEEWIKDRRKKPEKVLFVIVSDGAENFSKKYNWQTIKSMIEEKNDWQFVYIGTNQDVLKNAENINIAHGNTLQYDYTNDGIKGAFSCLSLNTTVYRSAAVSKVDNFFKEDKKDESPE